MAQQTVVSRLGQTKVGIESTFNTLATLTRAVCRENWVPAPKQTHIEVVDERIRAFKKIQRVRGLKHGDFTLPFDVKCHGTQLVTGAAVPTDNYQHSILGKATWGGETVFAGSVVQAGSSTTTVNVTGGHGAARFRVGQWIGVETGVSGGTLEWCYISAIATDALTVKPTLTGTPFTTGIVVNSFTNYITTTNTQALSVERCLADSNWQWRLTGSTGGCKFEFTRDGNWKVNFPLHHTGWTGPSAIGATVADAADPLTVYLPVRDAVTLIDAVGSLSRNQYPLKSIEVDIANEFGNGFNEEFGGQEGRTGVRRIPVRPAATIKARFKGDIARSANFTAGDKLSLIWYVPTGSNTTQRAGGIHVPTFEIAPDYPMTVDEGGQIYTDIVGECMEDETTTEGTVTDQGASPVRWWTA